MKKYRILLPEGDHVEGNLTALNYERFFDSVFRIEQFHGMTHTVRIIHQLDQVDGTNYQRLRESDENPVELFLEFDVALYQAKMNSLTKKMDFSVINIAPQRLRVNSITGFDKTFRKKASADFHFYSTDRDKDQAIWELYGYDVAKQSYTFLEHYELFQALEVAVVFVCAHEYSSFNVAELSDVVEFEGFGKDHMNAVEYYVDSKENQGPLYPNEKPFAPFKMNRLVQHIMLNLSMISYVIKHPLESNRRLAINEFVVVVANMANMTLNIEREFAASEFRSPPHGSGPLDYFLESDPASVKPKEVARATAAVKKRLLNSSSDYKGRIEAVYENTDPLNPFPVHPFPYIITSGRHEKTEEEEEEEEEEIVEAKATNLKEIKDISNGLGRLCAQMLDTLKRKKKRSISAVTSSSVEEERRVGLVKGILTTGQQSLFFLLREREGAKPLLEFKGRFAVKIFQNLEPGRDSSLAAGEGIEEEEVREFLKNLYYFLVLMD